MVTGISAGSSSLYYNRYDTAVSGAQSGRPAASRTVAIPPAQPELPVQPVRATPAVQSSPLNHTNLLTQLENDPTAMAVRSRIQYIGDSAVPAGQEAAEGEQEPQSVQEAMEAGECQTCKERKYVDGSDDPGVSFKTAAHIDPDQAASVVRAHEQEHVVRNQAKAEREDRKVVSQSVTLHTAICPECGRSYISGGTTRTVTAADLDELNYQEQQEKQAQNAQGFSAVA